MPPQPDKMMREAAARGKYSPLFHHLTDLDCSDWHASFREIETILGFRLPPSARMYRSWWSNPNLTDGYSHAFAWRAAGWKTRNVNLEEERLVLSKQEADQESHIQEKGRPKYSLDRILPPHNPGTWPRDFRLSRSEIYGHDGR